MAGLKTHRMVSEDEKRVIAYHEAGHAVLAHIVGRGMTIHKVTIVPRGGALGYNMYLPTDERVLATRDDLITRIVVLLGGRAGEQVALGEVSNGAGDDLERCDRDRAGDGVRLGARRVADDAHGARRQLRALRGHEAPARPGAVAICDYAYAEAMRLLEEHREALERLASKLLERETLDREDVATMLHDVQRVGHARVQLAERARRARLRPRRLAAAWWLASLGSRPSPSLESSSSPALAISAFLASTAARASRTRVASAPSSLLAESVPASNRSNAAAPNAALRGLDLALQLAQLQLQLLRLSGFLALLEGVRRLFLDLVEQAHVRLPIGGCVRVHDCTAAAARRAPWHHPGVSALGIHHVGIAVRDLEVARERYERLFGARVEARERVEEQGVEALALLLGDERPRGAPGAPRATTPRWGASSSAAARACTISRSPSTICPPRSRSCARPGRR